MIDDNEIKRETGTSAKENSKTKSYRLLRSLRFLSYFMCIYIHMVMCTWVEVSANPELLDPITGIMECCELLFGSLEPSLGSLEEEQILLTSHLSLQPGPSYSYFKQIQ